MCYALRSPRAHPIYGYVYGDMERFSVQTASYKKRVILTTSLVSRLFRRGESGSPRCAVLCEGLRAAWSLLHDCCATLDGIELSLGIAIYIYIFEIVHRCWCRYINRYINYRCRSRYIYRYIYMSVCARPGQVGLIRVSLSPYTSCTYTYIIDVHIGI